MTETRHCTNCDWTGFLADVVSMSGFEFCPECGERYIGFMPESPKSEIKVGDLVRWKSQANASRLLKVGVVVGIVGPNERVLMYLLDYSVVGMGRSRHHSQFNPNSMSISEVSYVVSVRTGKTDKAKRTLYHPRQEVTLARPEDRDGVFGWHTGDRKWVRV